MSKVVQNDLEYLRQKYPGVSEIVSQQGGLMTRPGGECDYYKCEEWMKKNICQSGFIEIGSAWGASFHLWGSVISEGPKISVDYMDLENYPFFSLTHFSNRNKTWMKHFDDAHVVYGKSSCPEVIDTVGNILNGRKVGWLYIDGNHTYQSALIDYGLYKQFVKVGGYIGFHDISDGEIRPHHMHYNTSWQVYSEIKHHKLLMDTTFDPDWKEYRNAVNHETEYYKLNWVWETTTGDGIGIFQVEE